MTDKHVALILGGFIPAILFGVVPIFQKVANREGMGTGPYLMGMGLSIFAMGALYSVWDRDLTVTPRSALFIALFGIFWSISMACVAVAIKRYNGQISQLVSIYNLNTLVTVIIGLTVLSEWKEVHPVKLLIAAAFICAGGILAARA